MHFQWPWQVPFVVLFFTMLESASATFFLIFQANLVVHFQSTIVHSCFANWYLSKCFHLPKWLGNVPRLLSGACIVSQDYRLPVEPIFEEYSFQDLLHCSYIPQIQATQHALANSVPLCIIYWYSTPSHCANWNIVYHLGKYLPHQNQYSICQQCHPHFQSPWPAAFVLFSMMLKSLSNAFFQWYLKQAC